MTHDHSALLTQLDALKGADPGSVFAELIRAGLQALIDAEATQVLGADRYERTAERTNYRNGTRPKTVSTTRSSYCLRSDGGMDRIISQVARATTPAGGRRPACSRRER